MIIGALIQRPRWAPAIALADEKPRGEAPARDRFERGQAFPGSGPTARAPRAGWRASLTTGSFLSLAICGLPTAASSATLLDALDAPPRPPGDVPNPGVKRGPQPTLGAPLNILPEAQTQGMRTPRPAGVIKAPKGSPLPSGVSVRFNPPLPAATPSPEFRPQTAARPEIRTEPAPNSAALVRPTAVTAGSRIFGSHAPGSLDLQQRPLQLGDRGDAIRRLQEGLARLTPLEPTGTFDSATEEAVRTFQTSSGLAVSGQVGAPTYATLWHTLFWDHGHALDLNGPEFYASLPKNMRLSVDIATQRVTLLNADDGSAVKSYPIASGAAGFPTPRGNFRITQIRERPTWTPPKSAWAKNASVTPAGPRNPLGPAALRLDGLPILFHGVPRNEFGSIGKRAASHGCMRMFPQDAFELHKIVRSGTPVEVR